MRQSALTIIALSLSACSSSSSGSDVASGNADNAGSATCAGDRVLTQSIDPHAAIRISNGYIWYSQNDVSLSRVSIAGGAPEIIEPTGVGVFDVNAAGVAAWVEPLGDGKNPQLVVRDPAGATQKIPPPDGAHNFSNVAVDGAGNVFVMTDWQHPQFGQGTAVWRWSSDHKSFDQLHRVLPQMGGFYRDGDGIAWSAPADSGALMIYTEDAQGGPPTQGTAIQNGDNVFRLSPTSIDILRGGSVYTLDRKSGASELERTLPGNPGPGDVAADDAWLYWLIHDHTTDDASIMRAPRGDHSAAAEVVVKSSDLGALSLGSCSVVFLAVGSDGNWEITTKPR
jgi:hypothetical protein